MSNSQGPLAAVDARMATVRDDDRQRRIALGGAVVVGILLVFVHWIGLFVAGAIVGLTRRSLPRALAAGLAFGIVVLAVNFVVIPAVGPGNVGRLAPLSYVTVALAVLGPTWGALARGVL